MTHVQSVVVGFVAVLMYGHVISVRLAVLIFLLFAAWSAYLVVIWPNLRHAGNDRDRLLLRVVEMQT